jgi:hypothetical protein
VQRHRFDRHDALVAIWLRAIATTVRRCATMDWPHEYMKGDCSHAGHRGMAVHEEEQQQQQQQGLKLSTTKVRELNLDSLSLVNGGSRIRATATRRTATDATRPSCVSASYGCDS